MRQVFLFVQMAAIVVVAYLALVMVNRRLTVTGKKGRQVRRQLTVEVPGN